MRAGIYYRVSSEEQVQGYSLDAQRRALVAFCAAQGWAVAGEYKDEGKSARSDRIEKRPAFRQMMEDAEGGLLDVVVVHKIDRFARNIRVTFECLERLGRHGVGFVATAQPDLDYSRPEGRLVMGMMATLAQYYSDNLSQETKKGKAERKAQGLYNGRIPFGMAKGEDGVPVADPATVDGLRLAFEMAADGHSDRAIAQALNTRGYRTAGYRTGRPEPFSKDTVCAMLQNRFYLGELPGAAPGSAVPARHDAVIDRAVFAAAQAERERRASVCRPGVRRDRRTHSLTGLGVCARCGGRLTVLPGKGRPRLYCSSRQQTGACTSRSAPLAAHEAQLATFLAGFTIPADYRERLRAAVAAEATPAADAAVRRGQVEGQLARLQDLYLLGDLTKPAYLAERDRLRRELAALAVVEDGAREHLAGLAAFLGDVARAWAAASAERRNERARALFEEVVIDDERVVAVKPRPELAGFFTLDREARVCRSGSDGLRIRTFTQAA